MVVGRGIDGNERNSCRCGLEKGHDGCCVGVWSRRRGIGFAGSFQVLTGEMRKKALDSWNQQVRLGDSRSG